MKRFIYVILALFLSIEIFSTSVFAASAPGQNAQQHSDPSGYDSWSTSEKVGYWVVNGLNLIGAVTGFGNSTSFDTAVGRVFTSSEFTQGYDSLGAFLAGNSSYNDTTMTWTFSDDAMAFIKEVLDSMKEEVTYVEGYPVESKNILGGSFDTNYRYKNFCNVVAKFNDCYVVGWSSGQSFTIDGNKFSGWQVYLFESPEYAVCSDITSSSMYASLYNANWELCKKKVIYIRGDSERFIYKDAETGQMVTKYLSEFDYDDVAYDTMNTYYGALYPYQTSSSKLYSSGTQGSVYSDKPGSIPVFKSVAAMKNGTTGGMLGQFMPGYTGQITGNTITQKEINDFSTNYNYYYGSGSGGSGGSGSGSGSGSSGGSWIDNIVSGLTNLGSGIITIISKVFEIITEILKFFTETLADVIDIIPTGFTQFLGALFPFFPEEWITGFSLFLTLLLVGAAIKIFIK